MRHTIYDDDFGERLFRHIISTAVTAHYFKVFDAGNIIARPQRSHIIGVKIIFASGRDYEADACRETVYSSICFAASPGLE